MKIVLSPTENTLFFKSEFPDFEPLTRPSDRDKFRPKADPRQWMGAMARAVVDWYFELPRGGRQQANVILLKSEIDSRVRSNDCSSDSVSQVKQLFCGTCCGIYPEVHRKCGGSGSLERCPFIVQGEVRKPAG